MSIKDKILDAINSLLSFPNEVPKELKEDNEEQEQEQEQEETLLSNDDYNFSNEGYIAATEPKPQPKEFLINGSIKRGDL